MQYNINPIWHGWGGENGVLGLPLDFMNIFLGTWEGGHPMGFLLWTGVV